MSPIGRTGGIRSVDIVARSELIYVAMVAGGIGFLFGFFLGIAWFEMGPAQALLLLAVPMSVFGTAVAYYIVDKSGRTAGGLHSPTGASTPRRYGLSREESLIVAGHTDDAIEALIDACAAYPDHPRPPLMLAELYRDQVGDLEAAAQWYRRAAAVPGIPRETERQILRTLVELCRDRIGRPELAAPALSRTAHLNGGDRLGHWARKELEEIRRARFEKAGNASL